MSDILRGSFGGIFVLVVGAMLCMGILHFYEVDPDLSVAMLFILAGVIFLACYLDTIVQRGVGEHLRELRRRVEDVENAQKKENNGPKFP